MTATPASGPRSTHPWHRPAGTTARGGGVTVGLSPADAKRTIAATAWRVRTSSIPIVERQLPQVCVVVEDVVAT